MADEKIKTTSLVLMLIGAAIGAGTAYFVSGDSTLLTVTTALSLVLLLVALKPLWMDKNSRFPQWFSYFIMGLLLSCLAFSAAYLFG